MRGGLQTDLLPELSAAAPSPTEKDLPVFQHTADLQSVFLLEKQNT